MVWMGVPMNRPMGQGWWHSRQVAADYATSLEDHIMVDGARLPLPPHNGEPQ